MATYYVYLSSQSGDTGERDHIEADSPEEAINEFRERFADGFLTEDDEIKVCAA